MVKKNYYNIDNLFLKKMIRIPVILIVSPRYNWLSGDAKIIYAMMLELSRSNNPMFDLPKDGRVKVDSKMHFYFEGKKKELMDLFTIKNNDKFEDALNELREVDLLTVMFSDDGNYKLYPLLYYVEENERELIDELKFATTQI